MGTTSIGAQLDRVWTADQFVQEGTAPALGDTYAQFSGQDCYMFVLADAAIAAYDAVGIAADFGAAPLTKALADSGNKIGVAPIGIASGSYGWVQIKGQATVNTLAAAAAGAPLYTTATAGSLDDASSSQTLINGLQLTATTGGAPAATACRMDVEPFAS